jgi:hypothetical protein
MTSQAGGSDSPQADGSDGLHTDLGTEVQTQVFPPIRPMEGVAFYEPSPTIYEEAVMTVFDRFCPLEIPW